MPNNQIETYVYIGGFELPDRNASAHRVMNMGKLLRKQGKRVVFIGTDREQSKDIDVIDTKKTYDGFEYYSVRHPDTKKEWLHYLTNPEEYIKIIEKTNNVRGVICYDFQSIALKRVISFCKKKGIRCYGDVTEWYAILHEGKGFLWDVIKSLDTWYRMRILHGRMDGLIVISRYLENYYQGKTKVCRIPVIIDTRDKKWENPYKKSEDVLNIVYAGNPGKKDRLDYLINALPDVRRPYHLNVLGITKEQYLKLYPEQGSLLEQLDNKVFFHGMLSHTETLEYVKKANYSCFFRDPDNRMMKAGFPTKFVESLACGTPVITNETSDLGEYFKEESRGILVHHGRISEVLNTCKMIQETNAEIFDYQSYNVDLL